MYNNIGGKIKGLAIGTFIFEAAGSIITGTILLLMGLLDGDEGLLLSGTLTTFCGPIVAWVSSWLLYGFGQLISNSDEVVSMMKLHGGDTIETQRIIKKQTTVRAPQNESPASAPQSTPLHNAAPQNNAFQNTLDNGKPCPYCKTIINTKICPRCRKENNLF